ncbi:hypothetical protein [Paracoccus sp. S1E-3]|uniref:hypothetical protein n=1 Tax=Paracoccus sp. S1E-3 TaxID=2756130 RepID=UPI0015EF9F0A|nr:hypothetical protein [Paracoccus sp. S1E-3]MBA4489721.1 hypothetical protein [Paracoccus sp. S1E-3]
MRLLKILVVVVILAFVALAGYAYLGDMGPRQQEMRKPVRLETGTAAPADPIVIPHAGGASATAAETAADTAPADDTAPEQADPNALD